MTIEFPNPEEWLPSVDRLNDVGEGLLAVAVGALGLFLDDGTVAPANAPKTRASRYERTYVSHGTQGVVVPSKADQLTVVCPQMFVGRAGEQQYQFAKGEEGKLGFETAEFLVEVTRVWPIPVRTTGAKPQLTPTPEYDEHRRELWRDGVIVWGALKALCLGGIERPWDEEGSTRASEMAIGPLSARDPKGPQATFACHVHVQLK